MGVTISENKMLFLVHLCGCRGTLYPMRASALYIESVLVITPCAPMDQASSPSEVGHEIWRVRTKLLVEHVMVFLPFVHV